jgi:hypothetical protein
MVLGNDMFGCGADMVLGNDTFGGGALVRITMGTGNEL